MVAENAPLNRRDRAAVAVSAVIPDIDGVGYVAERLTLESANRLSWYTDYHHEIAHNLLFGVVFAGCCYLISRYSTCDEATGSGKDEGKRPGLTLFLSLVAFHTHILGDVAGSQGPDGSPWAIPYLLPFLDWKWTWSGQWKLNAWPHFAITITALIVTFHLAVRRGYSPLEMISKPADRRFLQSLRQRFSCTSQA
jgi:membrane-bound metal-dependent hydrolase YbcI (DUF457 family)